MVKREKEKENNTKQSKHTQNKQTIKQKRQGRKGYTNNPGGSTLTLSGRPWCDGGLSDLYLWTFHFKFTFLFVKKKKGKVQEIRAYLNGNKKDGSLVGGIIDRRKKVPNQLASGKIEKLLDKYSFSR